ncbi:MAG: DUF1343 domain-containing protein [Gemmatimonadaceae bacterium]
MIGAAAAIMVCLVSCGQPGRKVAAGVGNAITPGDGDLVRGAMDGTGRVPGHVRPGISVLLSDSIGLLRGRTVGLITNHTGIDEHGASHIDLLNGATARAAGVRLVALYSPEHGIRGTEDRENLASGIDARTGLPVHSLYTAQTIGPPDSTLTGVDVLVVDLQDIGTRTWTYTGTVVYAMRAAARRHMPIVVLDRPNPLGGFDVNGPMLEPSLANGEEPTAARPGRAYALHSTPLRHGLTMGELARYFNDAMGIHADLRVVPAQGWKREAWFDETGLTWVRPSPNLPTLASAATYPALVPFEGTNVSVGRGTSDAFQRFGASWLPADAVVTQLNARRLPGIRFERSDFTPEAPGDGKFAGRHIPGVRLVITDRTRYDAGRTSAAILWALARTARDSLVVQGATFDDRFGRPAMRQALMRGEDPDSVVARDDEAVAAWRREVARYRLYQ